jgi:hypothetical protein
MAAEGGWQITESRKCIFRDPKSAIRKPLLFQEIATSASPPRNDRLTDLSIKFKGDFLEIA